MSTLPPEALERHYKHLTRLLVEGRVVPFLGAGANLCGRQLSHLWQEGERFLPSGAELSNYLKREWHECDETELTRVAQWVLEMGGSGELFNALHQLFNRDYPSTRLHTFLAGLPSRLESKSYPPRYQLIVTTNYDDLLENAFRAAGQPFDLVTYISDGEERGKFHHTDPGGKTRSIDIPNQYAEVGVDRRTVILKIHGTVNRNSPDGEGDSYVITEDHYIDYLTRTDLANLVPVTLAAKLRKSHFLFLGYGLRDWNMRVILHRIAGEQKLTYKSWAIQRHPTDLDQKFWDRRDVDIMDLDLEQYVTQLDDLMRLLPQAAAPAAARG
jgi:SIR2-like domain